MLKRNLSVILMTLASFAVTPALCRASASGYQYWGGFTANVFGQAVGIPGGQLYHRISGHGSHVDWDGANFVSVGNLCDTTMKFTYGNGTAYINGGLHSGCSRVGQWKYTLNANVPRGSACAELWAKQWRVLVARQCHYVTP